MSSDEQAIRDLVATWMEATRSGELETVLQLMADDVVFLRAGHAPMVGREAFAAAARAHGDQPAPQFDGSSAIQEIRVVGDWAYMWAHLEVVVRPPGGEPPIIRSGYTLSILRKEEGRWVLARDANMLSGP